VAVKDGLLTQRAVHRLERHLAHQHVAVHDEVAHQAIERMLKRGGAILLEKEVPDPAARKITRLVPMKCKRRQVLLLCSCR
jgi:anti-sigma factor RsiW